MTGKEFAFNPMDAKEPERISVANENSPHPNYLESQKLCVLSVPGILLLLSFTPSTVRAPAASSRPLNFHLLCVSAQCSCMVFWGPVWREAREGTITRHGHSNLSINLWRKGDPWGQSASGVL